MAPQVSCLFRLLFLLQLSLTLSLRIDTAQESRSNVSLPIYRVSRPELKQPVKRVPQHLQDIRPGFVDDDAGDVIRIIEPPPHFQQLKRLRQRQPQQPSTAVVWEQPRKLSTNRLNLKPVNADLLTQETQNHLQFPMEILASVRKTERLLQRQRQQQPPVVRQRHIQRQTHTLIGQKSLEQQRYQREQQQRLRATISQEHKRSKRVKRQTDDYNMAQGLKLVAHIDELLQNATRYLPDELEKHETTTTTPVTTTTTTTTTLKSNSSNYDKNRQRRQRLFKLQGALKKTTARRGRNFRHEATTTTMTTAAAPAATTTTATTSAESTSTLRLTSATPLASRLVNSRKSANKRNHLQQLPSSRSDDSVLYADVMLNIYNLWQEHDVATAQFVAPPHNNSDYRELDVYLKELDAIAKKLPSVSPITSLTGERELLPATPTTTINWYLINKEGMIYETHLNSDTKPMSALFHLFPDMPQTNEPITTIDLE
ncbi:ATP-dependent RNA helicase ddx46 [Drosophila grimshawi]|uniref:ATP-dependent RNA helicase ddx46 n=1 Tax=Drosophila grimshawi TaxID=7222 RepID=UPI000C8702BC|nr:ATP-dependent RNA helicase ddx46 [Drosophila grimshawi]